MFQKKLKVPLYRKLLGRSYCVAIISISGTEATNLHCLLLFCLRCASDRQRRRTHDKTIFVSLNLNKSLRKLVHFNICTILLGFIAFAEKERNCQTIFFPPSQPPTIEKQKNKQTKTSNETKEEKQKLSPTKKCRRLELNLIRRSVKPLLRK